MTNTPVSVRLGAKILEFVDAEAARRKWSRNAVIQTCVEYALPELERESVGSSRKKIADVSVGAGAQAGLGVDPGMPRGGKAHIEEIFQGVKVNIGLRAQGHFETVERMRGEGKSWDEIGNAIGWAGHAVQEWYQMESPKFPQWSEARMRDMAAAEDEALSATGGLLACSPDGCEVCHGSKGGVPGNENIVNGRALCDYCHAEQMNPIVIDKKEMNMLRGICAGKIPTGLLEKPAEPIEVDLCGFKSYNEVDGEWYICGKEKHGPKVKHGEWIKV